MFSKPIDPLPRYKAGYMEAVNQIAALTKRAEQAEAVAAGLRLLAERLIDALRPFAHHSLGGWDSRSERQYRIRVTEGQVARAGILLSEIDDDPDAAASALYAAAQELAAAFDDEGPWQSGPTQVQYDRQSAALAAWRRAAAAGGTASP